MMWNLLKKREGQSMAEYGLILALVAVIAIVGLSFLGPRVRDLLIRIGNQL